MGGRVDNAGPAKLGKVFLPSTFEERGTIVPFTTPMMLASRVRPDERHKLVLLMPSFSGSQGWLVVPWKAVPGLATMTVYDRVLYEDIASTLAVTPDAMRAASLRAAGTGLAGPTAKAAAEATLAADETQRIETHFLLILRLLQMQGIDHAELSSIDPKSGGWKEATKSMLDQAAQRLHLETEEVYARLDEISRLLAPIGIAALNQGGRSRRIVKSIDELREANASAALDTVPEAAELHQFAAVVAQHTIEIAERLFELLDGVTRNMSRIIGDWGAQRAGIVQLIGRISWLLDGWDQTLGAWDEVARLPGADRNAQLPYFVRFLPLVPRNETGAAQAETRLKLEKLYQTHRVRNLEDWRSGELDVELVRRIEAARAKAAQAGMPTAA